MIRLICPQCSEPFEVPDSLAGKTEACPKCGLVCQVQHSGGLLAQPAERPMFAVQPEPSADRPTSWSQVLFFLLNVFAIVAMVLIFFWSTSRSVAALPAWIRAAIVIAAVYGGLLLMGLAELLHQATRIADGVRWRP